MGRMIGIEFGSDSLKFAVCSGGRVTAMAAEHMPVGLMRDGRIVAPAAMVEFMKDVCIRNRLPRGACALVMPHQNFIARRVQLPVMGEKELTLNLPYEFRDFVGKEGSKFTYDYSVQEIGGNLMTLHAAAIRTEIVEEFDAILRKAGFRLKATMPEEMAWLNLVTRATGEPGKLAIVDIGAARTRVGIYSEGRYEMGRDIMIGGNDVDNAISSAEDVDEVVARAKKESGTSNVLSLTACNDVYSALAVEVMRVLNFYRTRTPGGEALQDVYFTGGCSLIEPLRIAIVKRTDMTPHSIKRMFKITGPDYFASYCAIAVGAAIQLQ